MNIKSIRQALKSRTIRASILLAGLGALQTNIDVIPAQYRGHVLIGIAMLMVLLRSITTKPLSEK